jgi:hypothetical protein
MAGFKTFRVVTATVSVGHNFVTGSTAATGANTLSDNKGVGVIFQNQSTAATDIYIGGVGIVPSIGSTSTSGVGGVKVAQNGIYQLETGAPSGVQMDEWYVTSTSSNAVCVAQLIKAV